jgi:hypothetical protein
MQLEVEENIMNKEDHNILKLTFNENIPVTLSKNNDELTNPQIRRWNVHRISNQKKALLALKMAENLKHNLEFWTAQLFTTTTTENHIQIIFWENSSAIRN